MKVETDDLYIIFLLKKNVHMDIIKIILDYPLMAVPETLKEYKMAITSVEQRYKLTESWQDYQTGIETIYRGRDVPMDIGKARDNFDKDGKPKYFNCNIYGYMAKNC